MVLNRMNDIKLTYEKGQSEKAGFDLRNCCFSSGLSDENISHQLWG